MNASNSNSALVARFFSVGTERAEGPFDLVELAGQLRQATLNGDSLLCREGEERWIRFRDLPEFAAVRKMSLEKPVPPPEPKEKPAARPIASSGKRNPLPWIMIVSVIGLAAVAVLALVFHHGPAASPASPVSPAPLPSTLSPTPAPAPVQDSWPTTQDERFSIQGPVLLEKADGPDAGAYHYAGKIPGAVFSVVSIGAAHVHPNRGAPALNALRDKWLRANHGKMISEHSIDSHGREGREAAVTMPGGTDTTESGRIRFFVTDHGAFEVFVGAEPGKFSDDEMTRFLDSFEIR